METIKLDLVPGKKMPSLHASQFDDGRAYHVDLTENRVPYVLDGTETISVIIRKCDNTLVSMDIANTFADKSYLEFEVVEQMTACSGFNYGEIILENNGDRLGSLNFYLQVEAAPDENGITSKSEIKNLNRQITDEVDRILPDMVDEVAEPIVRELVPEVVGDNYYDKEQTDAKINEAVEDKVDEDTFNESLSNKYEQKLTQTLKVGENILTEASAVLGTNWSGTLAGGITHSSGSTSSLEFNIPTTYGKAYLVTFNATGVNNTTALNAKIGNAPLVDIYNGRTDFVVGFISDGGNLIFTPQSNYNGMITNLKLREVTEDGEAVSFEVKNVTTKGNSGGLSGFWNVSLGFSSFENNVNGSRNVAIGFESLKTFQTGTRNLALGTYAMNRLKSGERNIAVGADSMWYTEVANDCIAFGHNSMSGVGTDLANNVAIGRDTMGVITTGKNNVAIGFQALLSPQSTNVSNATAIGANAGNYGHTYGTYIGNRAGYFMKGISNTCIGYGSGAQQNASGARNTFIGATCGIDNTGATAQNPKNVDDSIVIGYGAKATKSKQIMLGSTDVTEVVACGNKKINFNQDGTVTWTQI